MRFLKQTASANVIYTGGLLKKIASDNHVSTCGFLSKPPVLMLFTLAVGKQPPVKKVDLYWPLALAALKNVSANSSRTATIELRCTGVDS
jgi:hypothetical protein